MELIQEDEGLCLSMWVLRERVVETCEVGNGVVVNGEQSGDIIVHTKENV